MWSLIYGFINGVSLSHFKVFCQTVSFYRSKYESLSKVLFITNFRSLFIWSTTPLPPLEVLFSHKIVLCESMTPRPTSYSILTSFLTHTAYFPLTPPSGLVSLSVWVCDSFWTGTSEHIPKVRNRVPVTPRWFLKIGPPSLISQTPTFPMSHLCLGGKSSDDTVNPISIITESDPITGSTTLYTPQETRPCMSFLPFCLLNLLKTYLNIFVLRSSPSNFTLGFSVKRTGTGRIFD